MIEDACVKKNTSVSKMFIKACCASAPSIRLKIPLDIGVMKMNIFSVENNLDIQTAE